MLNRSLGRVLFARPAFRIGPQAVQMPTCLDATRRYRFPNESPYTARKHKHGAKERRRQRREAKAEAAKSPTERGEEVPPFMIE